MVGSRYTLDEALIERKHISVIPEGRRDLYSICLVWRASGGMSRAQIPDEAQIYFFPEPVSDWL